MFCHDSHAFVLYAARCPGIAPCGVCSLFGPVPHRPAPAGRRSGPGAEAAASAAPGPPCRTPQAPATPAEGAHGTARVPPPSSACARHARRHSPAPPAHPIRRRQRRACPRPPARSPVSSGCFACARPATSAWTGTPGPPQTPRSPNAHRRQHRRRHPRPEQHRQDLRQTPRRQKLPMTQPHRRPRQDADPTAPEPTRPPGTRTAPPPRNDRSAAREPNAPPPPKSGAPEGRPAGAQPPHLTRTPHTPGSTPGHEPPHDPGAPHAAASPLAARLAPVFSRTPRVRRMTAGLASPPLEGSLPLLRPFNPGRRSSTAIRSTRRAPCSWRAHDLDGLKGLPRRKQDWTACNAGAPARSGPKPAAPRAGVPQQWRSAACRGQAGRVMACHVLSRFPCVRLILCAPFGHSALRGMQPLRPGAHRPAPAGRRSGPGAKAAASAAPGPPCRTPQAPATPAEGAQCTARAPPPSSAGSTAAPDTPAGTTPRRPLARYAAGNGVPACARRRAARSHPDASHAPGPPPAAGQGRPPAADAPQPERTPPPLQDANPIAPGPTRPPGTRPAPPARYAAGNGVPARARRRAARSHPDASHVPAGCKRLDRDARPPQTPRSPDAHRRPRKTRTLLRRGQHACRDPRPRHHPATTAAPTGNPMLHHLQRAGRWKVEQLARNRCARRRCPRQGRPTAPAVHRDLVLHTVRARRTPQRLPLAARLAPRLIPQALRPTPGRRLRKPVARWRPAAVAPLQPRTALQHRYPLDKTRNPLPKHRVLRLQTRNLLLQTPGYRHRQRLSLRPGIAPCSRSAHDFDALKGLPRRKQDWTACNAGAPARSGPKPAAPQAGVPQQWRSAACRGRPGVSWHVMFRPVSHAFVLYAACCPGIALCGVSGRPRRQAGSGAAARSHSAGPPGFAPASSSPRPGHGAFSFPFHVCFRRRPGCGGPCFARIACARLRAWPRAIRGGAVRAPDCARMCARRQRRRAHLSRPFQGNFFAPAPARKAGRLPDTAPVGPL